MILAIENSSSQGSVALLGEATAREIVFESPRGRGGALFQALQTLLADRPHLDRVVVGVGPGSYNGVRSAIAAAWGIAAAHQVPVEGVCSLLGLAEGTYCALGDARAGQYYFAHIHERRLVDGPRLIPATEVSAVLESMPRHPIYVPAAIDGREVTIRHASASRLAGLEIDERTVGVPEPLYLKPAHITPSRTA